MSTPHSLPITPRPRSGSAGTKLSLKLGTSKSDASADALPPSMSSTSVFPMRSYSTPRTPPTINANASHGYDEKPNFFKHGNSLSLGCGGGSLNEQATNHQGTSTGLGSGSTSSLLTMREYDETMRDLRKENFNLKLRIYFLEERLGTARLVAAAGSKEELVEHNIELKVC